MKQPWEYVVTIRLQNALTYLAWLDLDEQHKEFYSLIYEKDMGEMRWDEWVEYMVVDQLLKMEERLDMTFLM